MSSTWLAMGARVIQSPGVTAVIHGYSFMHWTYEGGGVADCNAGREVGMCGGASWLQYLHSDVE